MYYGVSHVSPAVSAALAGLQQFICRSVSHVIHSLFNDIHAWARTNDNVSISFIQAKNTFSVSLIFVPLLSHQLSVTYPTNAFGLLPCSYEQSIRFCSDSEIADPE